MNEEMCRHQREKLRGVPQSGACYRCAPWMFPSPDRVAEIGRVIRNRQVVNVVTIGEFFDESARLAQPIETRVQLIARLMDVLPQGEWDALLDPLTIEELDELIEIAS